MPNQGWFPDPAGRPDTLRYWDGTADSEQPFDEPMTLGCPDSPVSARTQGDGYVEVPVARPTAITIQVSGSDAASRSRIDSTLSGVRVP